ncbi:MAG: hypothetical protein V4719_10095 [Planctomycetota bacterium]
MAKSKGVGQFSKSLLTGDKALDRELKALGKRGTGLAKKGFSKALTELVKAMRREAPEGETQQVKKSIGKRFEKVRRSDEVKAKAGVNVASNPEKLRAQAPHAHLVALGSAMRVTKEGQSRGKMPSNKFINRAVRSSIGTMQSVLIVTIRAALAKYRKRNRKK